MTDGPSNDQIELNKNFLDGFHNWLYCICVVTFDLELGQALEATYPRNVDLSKQDISNICYLAFPDSNSGCMGDTQYTIRLETSGNEKCPKDYSEYNSKCAKHLQVDCSYFLGYVYFRQVKDITLPRGYLQKSVILLTFLPFTNLFSKICTAMLMSILKMVQIFQNICSKIGEWPLPMPGSLINLNLLDQDFQLYVPTSADCTVSPSLALVGETKDSNIQTCIEDFNLFEVMQSLLSHIHLLWELVITSDPL
ncbi:unnamed protein product [Acanthoscelides obtectus]|uniref:UDENN domain-containing protein n=1 Tax=Acanthoscelides obtectus TaxID=200917 RepID=A0A9P0MA32_ACAOB|nr:unnamed protein product [Acanthoscelides obtectus]CAK1628431.1 Protein DENND6B [Acanthoscelides obtectus]